MAAPFGNNNATKLSTDKLKKEAYEQYCAHLARGKSKRSWCFEHPELTLTWETMEKYIKSNEVDFDPLKKQVATIKGFAHWEGVVEEAAKGSNKDASIPGLQMVMRNKFGWDKVDHRTDDDSTNVSETHDNLLKQIAERQRMAQAQDFSAQ